mgnify:CR=1 FL=1
MNNVFDRVTEIRSEITYCFKDIEAEITIVRTGFYNREGCG